MNNKKMRAFIFGLIPMTLMQCYYWNWLIKSLTVDIDNVNSLDELYIIPVIVTLIYCVYEKFIVFSVIFFGTSFLDRLPLAVLWILENVIAAIASNRIVFRYEEKYERAFIIGFRSVECLFAGVILIVSFLFCRAFLYKKEES